MAEWIDPRYAHIIEVMRRAQAARRNVPGAQRRRVRGFVLPTSSDGR